MLCCNRIAVDCKQPGRVHHRGGQSRAFLVSHFFCFPSFPHRPSRKPQFPTHPPATFSPPGLRPSTAAIKPSSTPTIANMSLPNRPQTSCLSANGPAASQPPIFQTPAPVAHGSCAPIRQALDDSSHIKTGMTRAQVEKNFRHDGGLQFFSQSSSATRYVYLKCSFIKIDVKFKAAVVKEAGFSSPDDILVSVSKPYLEYPFTD